MRRAFADTLVTLGRLDERVVFLTGDLGFQVFDNFQKEFPQRYINVGVAEAQLVDCAAGMALAGWKPLIYSIASFLTGRAFEHIRLSLGYHRLPVVVIGAGGGYAYAKSGVTHHAKEDLALMGLVPGMTVLCPGGPDEVTALLPQLINAGGPSYLRLGRFGEPPVPTEAPIQVGRGRLVRDGTKVAFITTGSSVIQAGEAADRLRADGIRPIVAHFHTVCPLDYTFLENIARRSEALIVVEDHGNKGGLRAAVSHWLAGAAIRPRLIGLGPTDDFILGNPSPAEVFRQCGVDTLSLMETARTLWSSLAT